MRAEMIHDIEVADPAYVIFVDDINSWATTTAPMDRELFDWFEKYRQERLRFVGFVKKLPNLEVEYHWIDSPQTYPPADEFSLAIFKRK